MPLELNNSQLTFVNRMDFPFIEIEREIIYLNDALNPL